MDIAERIKVLRYLFWNTHNNCEINDILSEIIVENDISIVLLAEYTASSKELIECLKKENKYMNEYSGCSALIKMFAENEEVQYRPDADRAIIRIINGNDILCCVHLNSKIYSGHDEAREIHIEQIMKDVRTVERELGSENTIIVGDFNINPYDASFVDARYFHGIPGYEEAKKKSRIVAGKEYRMFYNPMWNLLGDFHTPYGTYYYNGNNVVNTYWNMYDQVIMRPDMKHRFVKESLKIICETKTRFLLDINGHPNKRISDHLPIIFEISGGSTHE